MGLLMNIKRLFKYILSSFLLTIFFFWWISNAQNDDVLWLIMAWTYDRGIVTDMWDTPAEVGGHVLKEWTDTSIGNWVRDGTSVIVKVTRLLLSLVVVLSVTMILYHWMSYIIQTWQWKEWKNLVTDIIYIVVGIIISLFSVTIITIIQSIWPSIEQWTTHQTDNRDDNEVLKGQYLTVGTYVKDKINDIINDVKWD